MDECEGALRVGEFATPHQRERVVERHAHQLDHLIDLAPMRHRLEIEGGEEVDALVGEAGRGPDRGERHQTAGASSRLFFQLARGTQRGRIAVGQIADIVLWSGDPLEVTTVAEEVFFAGRAIEMRSRQTELRERYLPHLRNRAAR